MAMLTPIAARERSLPQMLGQTPFFNRGRVETLLPILALDGSGGSQSTDPRVAWEWNTRVRGTSTSYVVKGPIDPFQIASYYIDPALHTAQQAIVNGDSSAAVDLAVRWRVTGNADALAAVIRILDAWSRVAQVNTTNDSALVWAHQWPKFIQAAMMVRGQAGYTTDLHDRLCTVTLLGIATSPAFNRTNNWAAWGVVGEIAAAVFLQDRARLLRAMKRWRLLLDIGVVDNVPIEEVHRSNTVATDGDGANGLWYSNFYLDGMTVAAEWARFAGEWLYDYRMPDGSTFRGLCEKVRRWTRYPAEFPYNTSETPSTTVRIMAHDDILHALWPSPESAWLLANFKTGGTESRDAYGLRQWVLAYRGRPLWG